MTATEPTTEPVPLADIDRSPTILLASLFSARRSGDAVLARLYLRRLALLGIHIQFGVAAVGTEGGAP